MAYEFASPVTEAQLARLDGRPQIVQFGSALSQDDYRLVGDWIQHRPQVTLRAYGAIGNLDFLRWFPSLMRFAVDARWLDDLDGLRHLPENLEVLHLGATKKRLSVRALSRFREMRSLSLEGHTKDVDVVGGLTSLVDLTLRSITVPNLGFLEPLDELRALDLKLGGTTDLGALRRLGRVQYLELWQIRGLADISVVSELPHLEYLFLQSLRSVERLPDLSTARDLRVLWFETMKGLTDLSLLSTAPAVEHVALIDMGHLSPEAVAPLLDCPALKSARVGLGSHRKNNRVHEILGPLVARDDEMGAWDSRSYRFTESREPESPPDRMSRG